jgi:hypothetical protein
MHLKHVLGQVDANRGNLTCMWTAPSMFSDDHLMAHRCRERAPSTTGTDQVNELGPCAIISIGGEQGPCLKVGGPEKPRGLRPPLD